MRRLGSGIAGFGRFWYDFIVGSDPLMAMGVAVGLIATALLLRAGVNAYWLMPLLVVTTLGISLRGARST